VWVSRGRKLTAKALRRGVVKLPGSANRRKLLEVTQAMHYLCQATTPKCRGTSLVT
jgi:hypothetical protein